MSVVSQSARGRGQFNDPELDLSALGTTLWRKRWKILRPTILVGLVTLLAVQVITPRYQSESRVIVESRDNIFLRPEADKDLIDRNTADQESVTSQAQLILSRDLARDVIAKLKLNELPEFDSTLGGVSPVKTVLGMLGIIKNPASMTPEERVLEAYYDRLTVFPVEKSRVIVIDFLSEDPELAARVANTIADDYLQLQRRVKQEQAQNAGQVLAGQIDILRKKVVEAESKVEAYRAKSGLLVGNNNTTLSAQQLGDMNAQLAASRAQKTDAEAKARLIREMLKSGQPIESSDVLNSELIRRLSEQRVTLRAQLAEQSSTLLDNHPRIKELKAQIADLDHQITQEAATQARSFENDAPRSAQEPGGHDQCRRRAAARARARCKIAARSVGELSGQIPRGDRARHREFRAGRCARDLAGDGVERAGLSEEGAGGADRDLDHAGDCDRLRADQGAFGIPHGRRAGTAGAATVGRGGLACDGRAQRHPS
jgi:uncharacterized protein involved in exopolysaccharide biosynthesis